MIRALAFAVLLVCLAPVSAMAAGKSPAATASQKVAARIFNESEKAIIEEYFGVQSGGYTQPSGSDEDDEGDEDEQEHGHRWFQTQDHDEDHEQCKGHEGEHGKDRGEHGKGHKCKHKGEMGKHAGKTMPHGLQKHLEKNGRLPPGLEGRDLPPGLAGRLPAAPVGTKRMIVGSDVVLVDEAKQVVLDVIKGALDKAVPTTNNP